MKPATLASGLPIIAIVLAVCGLAQLGLVYSEEGVAATATLLFLGGLGLGASLLAVPSGERRMVAAMFGAGLGLRAVAAVVIYHWNPLFFSLDQLGYFRQGAAMAARWHAQGGGPSFDWLFSRPGNYYADMWGVLSYYVGPSELALRIAMGVVGAYTAVRIYLLGKEVFGPRVGIWAGWLCIGWPSLIIWSAQGLRDPLLVWLYCEAGLGVIRICRGRAWRGCAGIAAAIYGCTLLRPYSAVVMGLGCSLGLVLALGRGQRGGKLVAVATAGLILLACGFGFLGADFVGATGMETLVDVHHGFQEGGSSFGASADLSSYSTAVRYLPLGLAYFVFAPFPWQTGSALQMSTMLERPLWYVILVLFAYGVVVTMRRRGIEGLAELAIPIPMALLYGLVVANVGTAYRDRAQVLPFVFIYAVEGALAWRARRIAPAVQRSSSRRRVGGLGLEIEGPVTPMG